MAVIPLPGADPGQMGHCGQPRTRLRPDILPDPVPETLSLIRFLATDHAAGRTNPPQQPSQTAFDMLG